MLWTDDELTGADFATRARFIERFRESSQVIPVANTTARAQLVTDIASWFTPSAASPLWVYRQDAPQAQRLEYTTDGSTFITNGGKSGYATVFSPTAEATVTHGLGYTPADITCQVTFEGSGSEDVARLADIVVWARGATTFTVRSFRRDTNAAFVNNTVGFSWLAR